ncbi:MAG: GAF domain-containing protein, partial [Bdellovibrionota bacterium]
MSSAAKKKDDEALPEPVDLPTDRELKLSKNFEDPALDEMIPGLGEPGSGGVAISVVEEAAEAVQELVNDAGAIDLSGEFAGMQIVGGAESFDALPIPEDEPAPVPPPVEDAASRRALPKTVNPNPDPLERSLLMEMPKDSIEDPVGMLMFEGQKEETGQVTALYSMSDRLFDLVVCERTFEDLIESALRAIMSGVDAQAGSVLELDHQKEDFFFRASFGGSSTEKLKAFRVPLTKGIVGHVVESGQALLIRDLAEDQMQMRAISLSVGFEAKTCMAAPIIVGGQPYGVIEVF